MGDPLTWAQQRVLERAGPIQAAPPTPEQQIAALTERLDALEQTVTEIAPAPTPFRQPTSSTPL